MHIKNEFVYACSHDCYYQTGKDNVDKKMVFPLYVFEDVL